MNDQLYTIQEVASILKVSSKTLRRWEQAGIIKTIRTAGNQRRYRLEDIRKLQRRRNLQQVKKDILEKIDQPFPQAAPIATPQIIEPLVVLQEEPQQSLSEMKPIISKPKDSIFRMKDLSLWMVSSVSALVLLFGGLLFWQHAQALGVNGNNITKQDLQASQKSVLAAETSQPAYQLLINVPGVFGKPVTFLDSVAIKKGLTVNKVATLSGGIVTKNANINAGNGKLTASNVIYSIQAGANISISGNKQNPTISANVNGGVTSLEGVTGTVNLTQGSGISLNGLEITNSGVLSVGGQTGDVSLSSGNGISISGTTITNSDTGSAQNIFKTFSINGTDITASSNSDTFNFAAGSGIVLTGDTGSKTITITSNASGTISGLTPNGSVYALSSSSVGSTGVGPVGTVLVGTGGAPIFSQVDLTADVSNILPLGNGGTGINTTPTKGEILIGNGSGYELGTIAAGSGIGVANGSGTITVTNSGVLSLTGTADQVTVSGSGALSLSLPQDIADTSAPSFAALTLSNATDQLTLGSGGDTGTITTAALTSGRTYTLPDGSGTFCLVELNNCSGGGGGGSGISGGGTLDYIAKFASSSGIEDSSIYDNGKVGIGTTSPQGLFSVSGAVAGLALVNFNDTGNNDIFTASESGVTAFTVNHNGDIQFTGGSGFLQTLTSTAASGKTYNFPTITGSTADICLSTGNCSGLGGIIGGSGSLNFIPKFTPDGEHIADSLLYDNGTSVGVNTSTPIGLFDVSGAVAGQALAVLNYTGSDQNILTGSVSGSTKFVFDSTGDLNLTGNYEIGGISVLNGTTLGSSIVNSSLTSLGTVTSGFWHANAIGTQYGGTGQDFSAVTQGSMIYFSGNGVMNTFAPGSAGQLLESNGTGAPSWISTSSVNFWQQASDALSPLNVTNDLLLGGTATSSAKFAFENVAGGIPTASISANTANNYLYLTGDGSLATTDKQTLTLGSPSTGNIVLSGFGTGVIHSNGGILSSSAIVNADLATGSFTNITGVGTLTAGTWNANLIGTQYGGTGQNFSSAVQGAIPYFSNTGVMGTIGAGLSSQCLFGGSTPNWGSCAAGINLWQENLGVLAPTNITDDLLLGGTATTSAKFAFINNIGSGTPTASISAGTANNNTFLTGAGVLGTTNAQTLTIGSPSTGDIAFRPGGQAVGNSLYLASNGNVGLGEAANYKLSVASTDSSNYAADFENLSTGNGVKIFVQQESSSTDAFSVQGWTGAATLQAMNVKGNGMVGIGTDVNLATLDVRANPTNGGTISVASISGQTSFASLVVDNSGNGDIFTASKSGATKFVINNAGNVQINNLGAGVVHASSTGLLSSSLLVNGDLSAGNFTNITGVGTLTAGIWNASLIGAQYGGTGANLSSATIGEIPYFSGTGVMGALSVGSAGQCLEGNGAASPVWATCAQGQNYWQLNSGAIAPFSSTADLLLGGTATASADFAFTGIDSTNPTASISAFTNSGNKNGLSLSSSTSTIQSLNRNTLTLGGNTTGDITFQAGGTNPDLYLASSGSVGIGTNSPGGTLTVQSTSTNALVVGANGSTNPVFQVSANNASVANGIQILGTAAGSGVSINTLSTATNENLSINGKGTGGVLTGDIASNANYLGFYGATSTNSPDMQAIGTDTNIRLGLSGQGNRGLSLAFNGPNYINVDPGTTGNAPLFWAAGGDTNIGETFQTKGTGSFLFQDNDNVTAGTGFQINFASASNNITGLALSSKAAGSGVGLAATSSNSNENFTLDGKGTGNLLLETGSAGSVGIGAATPLATLDVRGNSGTTPVASISGNTSFAGFVVNNSGSGDLFTASKSGATEFTILNNGNLSFAGNTNFLNTITTAATAARTYTLPDATGTLCLQSSSSCGFALGQNYWQMPNGGAIASFSTTADLLLGGTATASADFAFSGVDSTNPTASISAFTNSGNKNGLSLSSTNATIQSLNMNTLTIGGSSTGNIAITPNNGGAGSLLTINAVTTTFSGTTTITASSLNSLTTASGLTLSGTTSITANSLNQISTAATLTLNASTLSDASLATLTSATTLGISATTLNLGAGSAATIGTTANQNLTLAPNGTGQVITGSHTSGLVIGTAASTPFPLLVNEGIGNNAELAVNQQNSSGDIIDASQSGNLKFQITNAGVINVVGGNATSDFDTLTNTTLKIGAGNATTLTLGRASNTINLPGYASANNSVLFADNSGNGVLTKVLATSTANLCLLSGATSPSWGSCDLGTTSWVQANGTIYPGNSTEDLLIGGTATASADFAFSGVDSTNPTASISAQNGNGTNGLSFNGGTSTIQSLNRNTLTVGGNTTGDIAFQPGGKTVGTSLYLASSGNVGIGTSSPNSALDINGTIDADGSGDGFTVDDTSTGTQYSAEFRYDSSLLGLSNIARIRLGGGTGMNGFGITNNDSSMLLYVQNNGNVGIGTTTPNALLQVAGTASISGQLSLYGSGTTQVQSTARQTLTLGGNTTGDIAFQPGGTIPDLYLTSNGNVGIGTTSPLATLDVRGSSGTTPVASFSGKTSFAGLVVDQSGSGDIFTASASGATRFTVKNSGVVVIGNNTNGIQFDPTFSTDCLGQTFAAVYCGSARPTKQITLSAEYPGAVIVASPSAGTNINGFMTASASMSATPTSFNNETYYQWTSTQIGTLNQYTIALTLTLPKDWSGWPTSGNAMTIDYNTGLTTSADNALDVFMYQKGDTSGVPVYFTTNKTSGTAKNWTQVQITGAQFGGAKTWDSNNRQVTLYLTLKAMNSTANYVQVGDININYLSGF